MKKLICYRNSITFLPPEKLGFQNPTSVFFDACFKILKNVSKEEVILIGDSLFADIAGAQSYGIKTCWFNFNGENTYCTANPDYTVNSLEEITKIL